MTIQRKLSAGAIAAAVLINASTPALARDYGRGYGYGHHGWRHHRNHVDAGDVVAGVAVIAILAAILSASDKKKSGGRSEQNIASEDAAVDSCALAAEAKAGNKASVRDITQVERNRDGWNIEGIVEQRTDWNSNGDGDSFRFTCTVRYGAVQDVTIENRSIAALN